MSSERTGTLWEHRHTISFLQNLAGTLIGPLNLLRATLVNKDLVGFPTGIADKRNLAQLIFHHPFEVAPQITVDHEDVEDALMIRHKHVALILLKVLLSLNLNG